MTPTADASPDTDTQPEEAPHPVSPSVDIVLPPSLADALAETISGQHPMDIADALKEVLGRTMAVVRPLDLLRLCKALRDVSNKWYEHTRDTLLDASTGTGEFYGYRIDEVAPSRRVNYAKLEEEFPEAYAAVVTRSDTTTRRLTLNESGDK